MNKFKKIIISFTIYNVVSCASISSQNNQHPAPHNNYTGLVVQEHFNENNPTDFMIKSCEMYGGFNQDTIKNVGKDHLRQYIIQFNCNYNDKISSDIYVQGKSSTRLSGSVAKIKCQNLEFEIGTVKFRKCMEELTR